MVTVRSSGSPKYVAGFAALWAMVRNSFLRQLLMPGVSGGHDRDLREEVGRLLDVDRALEHLLLRRET